MDWRLKIIAKICFSRLPFSYGFWKTFKLFQLGSMEKYSYSSKIFNLHFKNFKEAQDESGFTLLELGPGDSLITALFGYALGARRTYLVDVGNFASQDLTLYSEAFDQLVRCQAVNVTTPNFSSFETMLESINAVYLCEGVESLKEIESDCVDFMFSHSVLEHVRLADLQEVLAQLFRVSKHGSTASHNVDYMDHLGGGQNHLRFSKRLWESNFFAKSGFYTNRIPAGLMHKKFSECGYEIISEKFGSWGDNDLPLQQNNIHGDLRPIYDRYASVPTSSLVIKPVKR